MKDYPGEEVTKAPTQLTFADLTLANLRRLPLFKNKRGEIAHKREDGSDWNLAMWTNALCGEAGEAANVAKKLMRGDFGEPGSEEYILALIELAKEIADVVVYADLACRRTGHMLGDVVRIKFNEVSDRVGCGVKL